MRHLFLIFVFCLITGITNAQVVVPQPVPAKKVVDYRKPLVATKAWVAGISDEEYYEKHYTFKGASGEIKNFKSLSQFDRRLFMLVITQKMAANLRDLEEQWLVDMKKLPDNTCDGKDDSLATKSYVQDAIKELRTLRVLHVAKWEALATTVFKEHADQFKKEEQSYYFKQINTLKAKLGK